MCICFVIHCSHRLDTMETYVLCALRQSAMESTRHCVVLALHTFSHLLDRELHARICRQRYKQVFIDVTSSLWHSSKRSVHV